jgi:DNA-nicking Smr family endonuclease
MANFGKVLEEWERLCSRGFGKGRGKTADDRAARARSALEAAMLEGTPPAPKDETGGSRWPLTKAEIAAIPVEAVLDLHGVTILGAQESLDSFFREAASRGLRKVLVIHGKGLHSEDEPVLGKAVQRFLETSPYAGRHGVADRRSGGSGAVWVLIKSSVQRSR